MTLVIWYYSMQVFILMLSFFLRIFLGLQLKPYFQLHANETIMRNEYDYILDEEDKQYVKRSENLNKLK